MEHVVLIFAIRIMLNVLSWLAQGHLYLYLVYVIKVK
jgi:hypothetical protein